MIHHILYYAFEIVRPRHHFQGTHIIASKEICKQWKIMPPLLEHLSGCKSIHLFVFVFYSFVCSLSQSFLWVKYSLINDLFSQHVWIQKQALLPVHTWLAFSSILSSSYTFSKTALPDFVGFFFFFLSCMPKFLMLLLFLIAYTFPSLLWVPWKWCLGLTISNA